jgi:hypothetical protein
LGHVPEAKNMAEPQPIQILGVAMSVLVPILTGIVAYSKASQKVEDKTSGHEKRIEGMEAEVHGMRGHLIEVKNDVKWIKEALQSEKKQ